MRFCKISLQILDLQGTSVNIVTVDVLIVASNIPFLFHLSLCKVSQSHYMYMHSVKIKIETDICYC